MSFVFTVIYSILLNKYTTIYFDILLLMDIWVTSHFCCNQQHHHEYHHMCCLMNLCKSVSRMGVYIGMELLGHMDMFSCSLKWCVNLHSHPLCVRVTTALDPPHCLTLSNSKIASCLMAMKFYLIVVLICIFLIINKANFF